MTRFRLELEVDGQVLGYGWSGPMDEHSFSWWLAGRTIARSFIDRVRQMREKAAR